MKMVDKDIQEWLSKYKRLAENEAQDFAVSSTGNDRLINALFNLFEVIPAEVQHVDPVCRQLFDLYRSKERRLQVFALQFVPALIWLYLTSLSKDNREVCGSVETFLLGVYNLEIVQADGTQVVETFRIPALGRPSVYHDPRGSGLQSEALTESALRTLNRAHDVWKGGPHPQYESFNTQNRFCILTVVMQHYNRLVDAFHSMSLQVLCKATDGLVSSGFGNVKQPRIPVHPSLLVEMLSGIYFALYNGHQSVAVQAIKATHTRACYELYSDVLLMTNGLLNSFQHGELPKKSSDKEGLLTPSGSKKGLGKGKQSITNASFKAKKLPDDIEFTGEEDSPRLSTVEEDGEHSMAKNLKAKLMNIGGKLGGGDKNRNRDNRRDSDAASTMSDGSDSVGVAIVKGGHSSKTMVDSIEMQSVRGTRRSDSREPGIDQLEDDLEKMGETGGGGSGTHHHHHHRGKATSSSSKSASASSSSASLVFSKKLGFTKSSSSSPTTGSSHHKDSHVEFRKLSDAGKHSAPTLPAVITESGLSPSNTNGMANNNSSNNSSSGGIFNRSGSGRASNHSTHSTTNSISSADKRASSEGRSSAEMAGLSIHGNRDKLSKIHSSISDSNLPPTVQSSASSSSSSNVVTSRPHSKTSATVNRNSFSTDL